MPEAASRDGRLRRPARQSGPSSSAAGLSSGMSEQVRPRRERVRPDEEQPFFAVVRPRSTVPFTCVPRGSRIVVPSMLHTS